MTQVNHLNNLREAFVGLNDDDSQAWLDVVARSGRIKTGRNELLNRVRLSFGNTEASLTLSARRSLLKSAPETPESATRLIQVLAACQLIEFFLASSRTATLPTHIDEAALAVRVLSRTTSVPVVPGLGAYADVWLDRRADETRRIDPRGLTGTLGLQASELSASPVRAIADDAPVTPELLREFHNGLARRFAVLVSEVSAANDRLADAEEELNRRQDIVVEQQQLTWWLLSGTDNGGEPADWGWAYRSASALNELTRFLPGPRAAPELFRRKSAALPDGWEDAAPSFDLPSDAGLEGFRPTLDFLSGRNSTLKAPQSSAAAALGIYDELILGRFA